MSDLWPWYNDPDHDLFCPLVFLLEAIEARGRAWVDGSDPDAETSIVVLILCFMAVTYASHVRS